jgi:hypothetical protein
MVVMAMRVECKHFESRTYANGETVRTCALDLAPEAPWRCPADCPRYERRLADVDWSYGSLIIPPTPPVPDGEAIAEVLDAAGQVVNAVSADVLAEVEEEERRRAAASKGWRGWFRRWRRS